MLLCQAVTCQAGSELEAVPEKCVSSVQQERRAVTSYSYSFYSIRGKGCTVDKAVGQHNSCSWLLALLMAAAHACCWLDTECVAPTVDSCNGFLGAAFRTVSIMTYA